jgi:hypothetical protein
MAFPTTEDCVARAESELGVRLPAEYRARLLSNNGGELSTADDDWQVFPVFDSSDRKKAARSASHIVRETRKAEQWRGFPPGAVAIAANGTGDLLVLLRSPSGDGLGGRVTCWDHETGVLTPTALDFS